MKTYRLECELLSPVHIGSGDVIDPLEYVIENGTLFRVSTERFILSMGDVKRREFESLIEKGNLVNIRKYMSDGFKKAVDSIYAVKVSAHVETVYKSKLGDIQNQLIVSPFIRTQGASIPFLPGSSLKGAIRTAVVSEQGKNSNLPKPTTMREEYGFEGKVLNYRDGKDDPFRAIKTRDVPLGKDDFVVMEIKNVSKNRNEGLQTNNMQMICEVSQSHMTGKTVTFETEISIDDTLISTHYLNKALSIEEVVNSCKIFYRDKMEKEHNKFYKNSQAEASSQQLLDTPLGNGSFLLRVGRFSGVESVTLDKYRNPRPPGDKGWGETRNLTEGVYPMGWIKATVR